MERMNLSDLKKLKADQIRRLKSYNLTSDGEYVCTIIVPQTGHIREQVEYFADLSNGVGGQSLEEINATNGQGQED